VKMTKQNIEAIYPLSPLQQGILFHCLYAPESSVYFEHMGCVINGDLNVSAFERAWQKIVDTYAALRTAFVWEGLDEPLQVVGRKVQIRIDQRDWRELPLDEQQRQLEIYLEEDRRRGFDLHKAPLMRVTLIRLSEASYRFIWSHHHIVMDGWSAPLLMRQLFSLYQALGRGEQPALKRSRPYSEYIEWLQGHDLGAPEKYWRERLRGFDAATPLPLAQSVARGTHEASSYAEMEVSLSEEQTARLRGVGRERHLTLNTMVAGAWGLLLSRYSGEGDVIYGVTVSGRPAELAGAEEMVGLFINTLPLRVEVREEEEVWRWLEEVQERQGEVQEYEWSPLVEVQGWSEVERGGALFESILVFENYPVDAFLQRQLGRQSGGLEIQELTSVSQTNYPLTLIIEPKNNLRIKFSYDCNRFEAGSIKQLLDHFQVLLHGLASAPSQLPLSLLPLLSPSERQHLLSLSNPSLSAFPQESPLHLLFEQQVSLSPFAIALSFEDQHLSYAELNARANQLAHHLRSLGVGPEVLVALCVERSIEMVVGLLAILKAGGAYLPLDPSYPQERLSFMMDDAQVSVLLTQSSLLSALPAPNEIRTFCLDTDWPLLSSLSMENPLPLTVPDNLAYLIYTSGSTGGPKAVMVSHHQVERLMRATARHFDFTNQDVWTLFHSVAFDFSVWEMWGALLCGGRLVVVPYWVSRSAEAFTELLREEGVTVVNQTPSAFRQLLKVEEQRAVERSESVAGEETARGQETEKGKRLALRYIIFGGEALDVQSLHPWYQTHGSAETRLVNMYGITETTVHVTYREITSDDVCRRDAGAGSNGSPIGRGLADLEVYLLDERLEPVPLGVAAQMYVGGAGVARGYMGRAELTAERFIPHPYSGEAGARLYRTGDLARSGEDGELEYVGRVDHQVKVRGYRIELGEIEAVLSGQEGVGECVVLAVEQEGGEKQLVGYVVGARGEGEIEASGLRQQLKQQLPEYMVPSAFMLLEEMPLTENGKVDRKALARMEQPSMRGGREPLAARTAVQQLMAGIYAEVLKVAEVGYDESFFEMGGHSLLATQVISRVREVLGVEVALRTLFERPSVEEMSEEVERLRAAARSATEGATEGAGEGESGAERAVGERVQAIARVEREEGARLPLSYAQQRLWFVEQLEPGLSTYNVPVGVRLRGQLDVSALERTLSEIVRRHEVLRTSFEVIQGEASQVIGEAQEMRLEVEDLSGSGEAEAEMEAERIGREEAGRGFELSGGRLMRVRLLKLKEEEHVLLLTMHHIISDGWSMSVLISEVAALYSAYSQGEDSPLAELQIQYADYAVWQREWLESGVLERQMKYWREQLGGELAVLELPTDRARPQVRSNNGAGERVVVEREVSEGLKEMSRREGVTMFMLLLAAWQTLLFRYSGQTDIVVGAPVANRNRGETEGLIGFFVNQLVMRTEMSGDPSFRELLQRVREVCLEGYAHQDVPFEKLVEELQPERNLGRSPLFQVMLSLNKAPLDGLRLPGLALDSLPLARVSSNVDLSLSLVESAQGISGLLEYDADLFDKATCERMAANFQTLLKEIVVNVNQPISTLQLMSVAEHRQLIAYGEGARSEYQGPQALHELFEQQAESTPERIALVYREQEISYGELNRRANHLAHYLRLTGAGSCVGVCLERGVEMIVGLLAVLKAGLTYVPLDPSLPASRLHFMIADAGLKVLLTQESQLEMLDGCGAQLACLEKESSAIAAHSDENPSGKVRGTDVAYMIYTSGTTGQPKAVMVEHSNLVNTILTSREKFQVQAGDVMPVMASFSFDISLFELLTPLVSGARAVLISKEDVMDVEQLAKRLEGVTMLHAVPSLMRQLVERIQVRETSSRYESLRRVFVGGDAVPPELLEQMASVFPESRIEVLYGPTEATIICASYEVKRGEKQQRRMIGSPLGNVLIRIKDAAGQVVPIGAKGEIWIGGAGITRGYLGLETLTNEKFVEDEGKRYYRSGDVGRYSADGNIEYLGRSDHQVKVRGFRIELGEIESVLMQHASVRECLVIARPDERGDNQLVAYLAHAAETVPEVSELRQQLKQQLPEYMVPSAFILLEEMPLTPNGKVDRQALTRMEQPSMRGGREPHAARTAVQQLMAGIYAEVLKVGEVGCDESFFEMGGHSLLATQVISRVREVLGVEVALRTLFERPSVEEMSEEVERLRAAARVTEGATEGTAEGESGAGPVTITRVEREDGARLPLSYAQQRLWFVEQLEPGLSTYNVPVGVRLRGQLDVSALERTLSEIVRRHEVLRTSFEVIQGEASQVIGEAQEMRLEVEDLSGSGEAEAEMEAERIGREEAGRGFELSGERLMRVRLLKLKEEEHVLLLTMHHIISDGWSMSVLISEVAALYSAYSQGQDSPLAELQIQYADFAVWQRQWLESGVLERQLSYWRNQLGGHLPLLELPTDYPRPLIQSYRGAQLLFHLSPLLSDALRALARSEGVTLFMLLLAAWQTLLSRYSGQTDIIVGTDVANRNRIQTESLIGFFVNQLVLRSDLSGNPSFRQLLQRVREVCLAAYEHQDVPFEKLVEELQPERSLSLSPLYQVMFVLQNAPQADLHLPGLELSALSAGNQTAKFDLVMTMVETGAGMSGMMEYSTDLFAAESVRRMAEHYEQLLESVVGGVEQRVGTLNLLTERERGQVLEEWNETAREYPRDCTVTELFEAEVMKRGEARAVTFGERHLTYGELNARANQLGHYLRSLGVGPEVLVGICVERSVETVVGLLAILKAGGAYLPLDPSYPQERLSFMMEDAQAQVLLTEEALMERMPAHWGQTLCLDSEWEQVSDLSRENVEGGAGAENLAYIIYTSGSTGKPKGVCVTHRAIVRLVRETDYVQVRADDVMGQASNNSFDAATFEMWGALLNGARLCGVSKEVLLSPRALAEQIKEERLTVMFLTTALFNQVAQTVPQAFEGMRALLVGGQALDARRIREVLEAGYTGRLLNGYGPTESTTFAVWHEITEVPEGARSIPIGRPLANTRAYILDELQQVLPIGVPGELYLAGDGLARAYRERPDLTAEKFIPDAFSREAGARLYRTGDVVRYNPDGLIEFIGRVDQQVKIRGFRIELGEIEAVMQEQGWVSECVVLAVEQEGGEKQLVAYVVMGEGQGESRREMREGLKEKLPEYMIPSLIVEVEEMPLTENGKVDRKALAGMERVESRGDEEAEGGARTAIEELIASIYGEVLEKEEVRCDESFFEMGGHSLLATQVISRVREVLGVEVALRTLFERPSVGEMSEEVERLRAAARSATEGATEGAGEGESGAGPATIVRVEREDGARLPLSYAQQRLWFVEQLEPGLSTYNVPVGVRLRGQLDVSALERTLSEIVRRHEVLRTSFVEERGQAVQVIEEPALMRLEVEDLSSLPDGEREDEVMRMLSVEGQHPFDLSRGPLLRVCLWKLSEQEHVLQLTMHHIISDGWSMDVLVREVAALYKAYLMGHPSPLPELSIQYADFAVWQRQWLTGEVLKRQLAYWRQQLAAPLPVLELPSDRARPQVRSNRGASERVVVEREVSEALKEMSRREGVTMFMLLLAAWQTLLFRYSGQTDIIVGTVIANRNRAETEGLIGFFVNTLVLRTDLSGDPTFKELLQRVREVCLEGYAHQDVPFEKLVEELQPERDFSRSPLFQNMFVLQNATRGVLELPGLTLHSLESHSEAVKFDLTFSLSESDNGLHGELSYSTDLFEAGSIKQLLDHFQVLLHGLASAPSHLPLSLLPLLSPSERQHLLSLSNPSLSAFPQESPLHLLFEQQVSLSPFAIALSFEDRHLSYAELNARANQLAHHLRSLGVGPEVLVALCVERSVEMVVGLLAILKAGGAYLPLDPSYPQERLSFMMEDAQVSVLLTQSSLLDSLPQHQIRTFCLDTDWPLLSSLSMENPLPLTVPDNLAYLIYTSGSTGGPKAVMVSHHQVERLMRATARHFDFTGQDVWTLFHSVAFDFSVWEMWGALLCGGRLVVVPYWVSRSAEAFTELLREEGVTVVNQTPSAFRQLLKVEEQRAVERSESVAGEETARGQETEKGKRLALRYIIFGGEALDVQSLHPWYQTHGSAETRLVNMYGITETTVHVTYREITSDDVCRRDGSGGSSPIGRGLADLEVYLLDERLEPVPLGVAAQMYVGGAGVARGYMGRAELTAERFIPHPYSGEAGARLYRTGDLARSGEDGELEYVGRVDHQVKVRGYRIELGEIEAVLSEQEGVGECVVLAVEQEGGEKQLVGYVVGARGEGEIDASGLRQQLKQELPEYMVPSAFMLLEEMPLTENGKVDRKALARMEQPSMRGGREPHAARTAVQQLMAGIYAEVLKVGEVGCDESFFEMGGHSLLATQVISRVREVLGVEVALRTLFERPSVEEMSEEVERLRAAARVTEGATEGTAEGESGAGPVTITRVEREDGARLPLSYAQQRLWFVEQLEPGLSTYNVPVGVRLRGQLDVSALERTLSEIVRRHEVLRTSFEVIQGEASQVIGEAQEMRLEVEDLSGSGEAEAEMEAERIGREEAGRGFELSGERLMRVRLLRVREEEHVLLLTMHHIISDGWSMSVLISEVAALYSAYCQGEDSPLAELQIQYADFAVWQRQWLESGVLARQLSYWRKQLGGALAVLELPTDYARPQVRSNRGASERVVVEREVSEALKEMSRREGVTMFMLLLAAWQTLLFRYSGQTDIIVGTDVANRNRGETEGLIGFFVNQLVMRTEMSGDPTFKELLQRVREVCLEGYAHQDVPFEKLVEELQPERALGVSPLFQVKLVLQNVPTETLELPGLKLSAWGRETNQAKLDLILLLAEGADGLSGTLEYSRDLFDAASIRKMLDHFATLLRSIVTQPEARIKKLEMLTEAEKQERLMNEIQQEEAALQKLVTARRRSIKLSLQG
jgi:amino acid adenylation domain-containing protein